MTDYTCQPFIRTKFLGPTNYRPARVRATNATSGETVVASWEHALDTVENHLAAVRALYTKLGQATPAAFLVCGTADSCGYIFTGKP